MNYDYVFPSPFVSREPQNEPRKSNGKKAIAFATASIGFLIMITTLFYTVGANSGKNKQAGISPTPAFLGTSDTGNTSPTPTLAQTTTTYAPSVSPTLTPSLVNLKTRILNAQTDLDGYRTSNGRGNSQIEIKTGRTNEYVMRGFVSFSLTNLPQGAKVEQAILKVYQAKVVGKPYTTGGNLKLDHLTYGDSLDDTDYGLPALVSNIGTVSTTPEIEYKEVDVTHAVKEDIANARSRSQFRLHFEQELRGDTAEGDVAFFESTENTLKTNFPPQLVVKYY